MLCHYDEFLPHLPTVFARIACKGHFLLKYILQKLHNVGKSDSFIHLFTLFIASKKIFLL